MRLAKNDEIELQIDNVTSEGSGVGRYDGMAVFVRGTVPGDRILAHIIKTSKRYAVGKLVTVLEAGADRIESDCPCAAQCGGCAFRHMTYAAELQYKQQRVQEALARIGGLTVTVEEILGAAQTQAYRNKAQYPVEVRNGKLLAGFYAYKSHRIVPCMDCKLQPPEFAAGLEAFAAWAQESGVTAYDECTHSGLLRHIYFRKGFATGEVMACAVVNGSTIPQADLLVAKLRSCLPGLVSVVLNVNQKQTNVILGETNRLLWGRGYLEDVLLGKRFRISPNAFYQVNPAQCERLYQTAAALAGFTGAETLLDLYCGVGTIGITMAAQVKRLIGIEVIPAAVENAKENARLNHVENARFLCADAAEGAAILRREGIAPDVVLLDPPRKGCDGALLNTIAQMAPQKIVYVSCDSATLARDLALLEEKGYTTRRVVPVDMFPRTPHVEAVALLARGDIAFEKRVAGCGGGQA